MPLGPTSYGDSPYQTLSAFAGNPHLISLDKLVEDGLLRQGDLHDVPPFPRNRVDYGWIYTYHNKKLALAFHNFDAAASGPLRRAYDQFDAEHAHWLEEYALFIAFKRQHKLRPWIEWERELLQRNPTAISAARQHCAEAIRVEKFRQWLFYRQWGALKSYANNKGIRLIGDLPIFVAHDSADVWANQNEYYLDEYGNPDRDSRRAARLLQPDRATLG